MAFVELRDAERLAGYAERAHDLTRARLTYYAVNDPKKLEGEGHALEAQIRQDQEPAVVGAERMNERAKVLQLQRVLRRRRRGR